MAMLQLQKKTDQNRKKKKNWREREKEIENIQPLWCGNSFHLCPSDIRVNLCLFTIDVNGRVVDAVAALGLQKIHKLIIGYQLHWKPISNICNECN